MPKKAPQTAVQPTAANVSTEHPSHETIARRAHELWILRGCPIGSPEVDWERAEQELLSGEVALETQQTQTHAASYGAA